ncbi:uncharacterized protein [Henckelia pumila]|uniref:uncharacterized protein isoform X2 n=1 Tax=Henckelia pumila TaxID=405737 RepID=UPI003C6E6A66
MADAHIHIQVEESKDPQVNHPLLKGPEDPQVNIPLLIGPEETQESDRGNDQEVVLDKTLYRLGLFLSLLGFNQSSVLSFLLSWGAFLVIGVLLPVVMLELSNCNGCEKGQIKNFEIGIIICQACLAAASLVCVSHNLRKYGVRKFLFVDRYSGHVERFNEQYARKISASSLVQVVGIILCLNAAAKISHRAQGIGALASRWHALVTCGANEASLTRYSNSMGSLGTASKSSSFHIDYSESDLESLDFLAAPTNMQLASYMSSHHKRLALVIYLQANPGGITIFGWTVDRGLINTIFFLELSLVTFVLGKTIVIPSV